MSRDADNIERAMENAGLHALELAGLDLLGRAQRDAPIEEGTLRGAGVAFVERIPGGGARLVVAFPLPYAAVQEREDDFVHPRGGKAHYLGDNLKAAAPRYRAALEREVSRVERRLG